MNFDIGPPIFLST